MTKRDGRAPDHLTNDVLIRAMDDELSSFENVQVELHISMCDECAQRRQDLRVASDHVEAFAASLSPRLHGCERELLVRKLEALQAPIVASASGKVLRRFGWGMALAATLALAVIYAPKKGGSETGAPATASSLRPSETFEVNGETFVPLPYSNPDLPVSSSHVVEMQVPVSSLTDAGVPFGAGSPQQTALDHSVLADVLVGIDGQPLGLHILSEE